jgi:ferredoxin-NADP reductase
MIAEGTLELSFQKPAEFVFEAGQNINLKVPELLYEDARGPRRTFTVASAPEEPELYIATRLSDSGYKRTLLEIEPGAVFEYLGPQGSFLLEAFPHSAIFLAGGIGITPFRSMLAHAVAAGLRNTIYLLYGNARPETSAYHEWFLAQEKEADFFHYLPTMTDLPDDHPWPGERRWLSAGLALERVPEAGEAIFYLCGPPKMVEALDAQLHEKEVPAQRIRSESLWGY